MCLYAADSVAVLVIVGRRWRRLSVLYMLYSLPGADRYDRRSLWMSRSSSGAPSAWMGQRRGEGRRGEGRRGKERRKEVRRGEEWREG